MLQALRISTKVLKLTGNPKEKKQLIKEILKSL